MHQLLPSSSLNHGLYDKNFEGHEGDEGYEVQKDDSCSEVGQKEAGRWHMYEGDENDESYSTKEVWP